MDTLADWKYQPNRQRITGQLTESQAPLTVFSGLYPARGKQGLVRSLYIGAFKGEQPFTEAGAFLTFRLSGSRWGAPYLREFSLSVEDTVVIDAEGMHDVTLEVLAYAGTSEVQVVAGAGPNPPSTVQQRPLYRVQEFSTSVALAPVPPGCTEVLALTSLPGWQWHFYAPDGTKLDLPEALAQGALYRVKGTHFTGGAGGKIAWRVWT